VQIPLEKLGLKVETKITTMNEEERGAFLAMEQAAWSGTT